MALEQERVALRRAMKIDSKVKSPSSKGWGLYNPFNDKVLYFKTRKEWRKALLQREKAKVRRDYKEPIKLERKSIITQKEIDRLRELRKRIEPKEKTKEVFEYKSDKGRVTISKDGTVRVYKYVDKEIPVAGTIQIQRQEVLIKITKLNAPKNVKVRQKLKQAQTKTKLKQIAYVKPNELIITTKPPKNTVRVGLKDLTETAIRRVVTGGLLLLKTSKVQTTTPIQKYKQILQSKKLNEQKLIQTPISKLSSSQIQITQQKLKTISESDLKLIKIVRPVLAQKLISISALKQIPISDQKFKTKLTSLQISKTEQQRKIKLRLSWSTNIRKLKRNWLVNGLIKIGNNIKEIPLRVTTNRGFKYMIRLVDNTTARSFSLKIVGVTDKKDIERPSLAKFRPRKGTNPRVLTFVEKSKYAIDTKGEKMGLSVARYIKTKRGKRNGILKKSNVWNGHKSKR